MEPCKFLLFERSEGNSTIKYNSMGDLIFKGKDLFFFGKE